MCAGVHRGIIGGYLRRAGRRGELFCNDNDFVREVLNADQILDPQSSGQTDNSCPKQVNRIGKQVTDTELGRDLFGATKRCRDVPYDNNM